MTGNDTSRSTMVNNLFRELDGSGEVAVETPGEGVGSGPEPERVLSNVVGDLFPGEEFEFDEDMIKQNLDEILVVLIALRDSETHGKGLMEDLSRLFDARLSPGTVYPRLHEIEEEGVLRTHEMVRTKEYRIDDMPRASEMIENAMYQHLALGLFLHAALNEL